MRVINSYSPNQALQEGLYHLHFGGIMQESRAGRVIVSRDPVVTIHKDPTARVLVGRTRDANPFFHLFESLWMLAGRNDLAFPKTFVSTFGQFSDDGETLNGAYGHRWREYFGCDQLEIIIEELKVNPTTRRAVLQMWDAGSRDDLGDWQEGDLEKAINGSADVPCNTAAYFDTVDGKLNMTVTCRSNDVILGAYGANIVHFSILLEYVSLATGIPMGVYRQFSNNFHVYESQLPRERFCDYADAVVSEDIYTEPGAGIRTRTPKRVDAIRRIPLWDATDGKVAFDEDVASFMAWVDGWDVMNAMDGPWLVQQTFFFRHVVVPMTWAWLLWKEKKFHDALDMIATIKASDWRAACHEFVARRMEKHNA